MGQFIKQNGIYLQMHKRIMAFGKYKNLSKDGSHGYIYFVIGISGISTYFGVIGCPNNI